MEENKAMPFDVCIHDGVIDRLVICNDMQSTLNTAIVNGIIKKSIHITLLAFNLSTGRQYLGMATTIEQVSVDSWLLNPLAAKCS